MVCVIPIFIPDHSELDMGELLGAGGYGEVHRAMWKGTEVAVKTITSEVVTKEMQKNFIDEVSIGTAVAAHEYSLFGTLLVGICYMCLTIVMQRYR